MFAIGMTSVSFVNISVITSKYLCCFYESVSWPKTFIDTKSSGFAGSKQLHLCLGRPQLEAFFRACVPVDRDFSNFRDHRWPKYSSTHCDRGGQ